MEKIKKINKELEKLSDYDERWDKLQDGIASVLDDFMYKLGIIRSETKGAEEISVISFEKIMKLVSKYVGK